MASPMDSSAVMDIRGALRAVRAKVETVNPVRLSGVVTSVVGLVVESNGPAVALGDICEIETQRGTGIHTQVIGFRGQKVLSMPLDPVEGLQPGLTIIARRAAARAPAGQALLGRVIDAMGKPLDGLGPLRTSDSRGLYAEAPGPMERKPISEPLTTGVRAIDGFLPCGKGQRVGIFGGSGVGKSTLLGAIARNSSADVNVIALIGERNREVGAFLEKNLAQEGLQKSVVVVATSDRAAPVRVRAAFTATAIAEYFRDQGSDVLLVMDSVTRVAMAQREIGLAAGEPPSQKGYTPSVFQMLPKIFERAGSFPRGSITGIYTVLVEGDDLQDPIADSVRAILDGHIILSRDLAAANHYPPIDVLGSVSRLADAVAGTEHLESAGRLRDALAAYRATEDLIQLGAYAAGSNPKVDAAIKNRDQMMDFLRQDLSAEQPFERTVSELRALAGKL